MEELSVVHAISILAQHVLNKLCCFVYFLKIVFPCEVNSKNIFIPFMICRTQRYVILSNTTDFSYLDKITEGRGVVEQVFHSCTECAVPDKKLRLDLVTAR